MIRNYRFSFQEVPISRDEISALLGYPDGLLPEPFDLYLEEALDDAAKLCDIQGAVFISDQIGFNQTDTEFQIGNKSFQPGKLITKQLKLASHLGLFIATAGSAISDKSQRLLRGEDPVKGYVYDILGSVTVEAAMDKIQSILLDELNGSGLKLTNRYSPGYCDWSVKDQHQLFSFFSEKCCGITLNSSALMHPVKSVSGVIGIGEKVKFNKYHCDVCNSPNCIYRNLKKL